MKKVDLSKFSVCVYEKKGNFINLISLKNFKKKYGDKVLKKLIENE